MVAPEERIAEAFNGYFANFDIRIGAGDVVVGSRQEIRERGWRIAFRVLPDDAGLPSLEFYATHRMTNDRHVAHLGRRLPGGAGCDPRVLRVRREGAGLGGRRQEGVPEAQPDGGRTAACSRPLP